MFLYFFFLFFLEPIPANGSSFAELPFQKHFFAFDRGSNQGVVEEEKKMKYIEGCMKYKTVRDDRKEKKKRRKDIFTAAVSSQ